jgi:valyl-tRNA synthetase
MELAKAYDPKPVEDRWVKRWAEAELFKAKARSSRKEVEPYVIVIPPPNITGALHMGHALNNVLQDTLVRFHRMIGKEALWVPGTDHGGIATQNVVEKMLKAEGKTRHDLGREKFLERMWTWRQEVGDKILNQLIRLGCALDFSRKRFTMDEQCSKAVAESFTRMWNDKLIYRGPRMINWCPRCHTALSDIEVEMEERKGKLWFIKYPGEHGHEITVATTRPETMLGDTAVAVPPGSHKWKHMVGKKVKLPLTDFLIPVIEDEMVDASFGMGAVKITPAHDPNDFATMERHPEIGSRVVIGFDGKMTAEAGPKYAGLSREKAREAVLADLEAGGVLEKIEEHPHSVPTCYRCQSVIEPLVSSQWFVKMPSLAEPASQAAKDGRVQFHPESWKGPYTQWLDNIKDWCISRQIWWGHRIPAWYCTKCNDVKGKNFMELADLKPTVSLDKPHKCANCGAKDVEFVQDPDVLDTWFSSALWPFSVFGWPEETPDLKYFYPTTVLVTGYEILYLWVARMVMSGLKFLKQVLFSHVYIHGIVRDKRGKKMSKSLGNVVDPLVLMEKFGTDATRFSLITQAVAGRDIPFSDESPVGARNFANKLWNSARFVLMNLPAEPKPLEYDPKDLELSDKWILARYHKTIKEARERLEAYEPAVAAHEVYAFLWDEFCDWYIELAKLRLTGADEKAKKTAQAVLVEVLSGTLQLLHPFMPFITEELWQAFRPFVGGTEFLLQNELPDYDPKKRDSAAEATMALVMEATIRVRTARALLNVPPGRKIPAIAIGGEDGERGVLEANRDYVSHLARLETFELKPNGPKPPHSATAVVRGLPIYLPLEGLIDFDAERARIGKELEKTSHELESLEKRLSDSKFTERAPEEEVQRVKERKDETLKRRESLKDVLASLG